MISSSRTIERYRASARLPVISDEHSSVSDVAENSLTKVRAI